MNKITSKFNFFSTIQNLIKQNVKVIIFFALIILIVVVGLQIYFFYKNEKILELSIAYNDSIYSNSQIDFIEDMNEIAETKSFYGLLASLELINNKINNNQHTYQKETRLNHCSPSVLDHRRSPDRIKIKIFQHPWLFIYS